jgi:hypothetical protein
VTVLMILNDQPYGTERTYNGLRLAVNLLSKVQDVSVAVFLMGDVDRHTMETRFPGVHAIGDATLIPLSVVKPLPRADVFPRAPAWLAVARRQGPVRDAGDVAVALMGS